MFPSVMTVRIKCVGITEFGTFSRLYYYFWDDFSLIAEKYQGLFSVVKFCDWR